MSDRWTRLAPLTGIMFVVLLVAGPIVLTANTPGSDASGASVIKFYKDNRHEQQVANLLGALGVIFFIFFAGTLRVHFRSAGQDGLGAVSFGGGILIGVGGTIFSAFGFALADVPDKLNEAAAQALNVLNNDFFFPFAAGVAVFMLANAVAIIRGRSLPLWLGWVAVPIGLAAATPAGFFAFFAVPAWVLAVSIVLFIRGIRSQRPSTTEASAA